MLLNGFLTATYGLFEATGGLRTFGSWLWMLCNGLGYAIQLITDAMLLITGALQLNTPALQWITDVFCGEMC